MMTVCYIFAPFHSLMRKTSCSCTYRPYIWVYNTWLQLAVLSSFPCKIFGLIVQLSLDITQSSSAIYHVSVPVDRTSRTSMYGKRRSVSSCNRKIWRRMHALTSFPFNVIQLTVITGFYGRICYASYNSVICAVYKWPYYYYYYYYYRPLLMSTLWCRSTVTYSV